jgi:hypothetical protein
MVRISKRYITIIVDGIIVDALIIIVDGIIVDVIIRASTTIPSTMIVIYLLLIRTIYNDN